VFGKLGPLSTEEQAAGLKELGRTRTYVDLSRVGIWGWSGGGTNTLNAMFRKPDEYHVGIAVAAKPQPHLYNAWFQEIYIFGWSILVPKLQLGNPYPQSSSSSRYQRFSSI
jgi:dipeptidyl-peptidase-4